MVFGVKPEHQVQHFTLLEVATGGGDEYGNQNSPGPVAGQCQEVAHSGAMLPEKGQKEHANNAE